MLKQTITYTDWDDKSQTETLYFNITKTELADRLHMKDDLEALGAKLDGENRELTIPEVQEILNLVKTFMQMSYGVRSEDGKRFVKTPEVWEEFTQTAAYDAFLYSLFSDPSRAIAFLSGVLPADLRKQVEEMQEKGVTPGTVTELPTAPPVLSTENVQDNPLRDKKEPTDEELLKMRPQDMTTEQLRRAFALKNK